MRFRDYLRALLTIIAFATIDPLSRLRKRIARLFG